QEIFAQHTDGRRPRWLEMAVNRSRERSFRARFGTHLAILVSADRAGLVRTSKPAQSLLRFDFLTSVNEVVVSLEISIAHVFIYLLVFRVISVSACGPPWPLEYFRVVERRFDFERVQVDSPNSFHHVQVFGVTERLVPVSSAAHSAFRIEADGIDHK